jgi:hypothetical protein
MQHEHQELPICTLYLHLAAEAWRYSRKAQAGLTAMDGLHKALEQTHKELESLQHRADTSAEIAHVSLQRQKEFRTLRNFTLGWVASARSCWGRRNASEAYARARRAFEAEAELKREVLQVEASVQESARDAKRAQVSVATASQLCLTRCQRGHVSFVETLHLLEEGWRRLHNAEQLQDGRMAPRPPLESNNSGAGRWSPITLERYQPAAAHWIGQAALESVYSSTVDEASQVEKHKQDAQKHLDVAHEVSAAAAAAKNRLERYSTNLGTYIAAAATCRANHSASQVLLAALLKWCALIRCKWCRPNTRRTLLGSVCKTQHCKSHQMYWEASKRHHTPSK